jgi:hypothetical protein
LTILIKFADAVPEVMNDLNLGSQHCSALLLYRYEVTESKEIDDFIV